MNKYSRLGKNTLLVFIGNVGGKIIGLLMLPFYTKWLSVENYGTTDIINVYAGFLVGIVSCCIADSIFIFPKGQRREVQKQYFSSGICFVIISIGISALLFYVAGIINNMFDLSNSFFENSWYIWGLMSTSIIQNITQQFTRSIDKILIYGFSGVIMTSLTALLSFILIPQWGVSGFIWSLILSNILTSSYSFLCSGSYNFVSYKCLNVRYCIDMLKYSIPLIPNGFMWWIVNFINRPVMESCIGVYAIGLFAVANKFPSILSMVFGVFATSWQISVMEQYGKKDFGKFYNNIFRVVVFFLLLIFICITAFSKTLVELFATSNYINAWRFIPILTLGALFSAISAIAGSSFSAVKKSSYFFYSSFWGAITALFLNLILIPTWHITGAAFSVMLSFFVMAVSRIIYSWKYVQLSHLYLYLIMLLLSVLVLICVSIFTSFLYYAGLTSILLLLIICNLDILREIKLNLLSKYKKYN